MKYILGTFLLFLFLFIIFVILFLYKKDDGVFDTCIYKFEECVLGKEGSNYKAVRVFVCANKSFLCNVQSLYYSFFNEDKIDEDYNNYMQGRLRRELEAEEKMKAMEKELKENAPKENTFQETAPKEDVIDTSKTEKAEENAKAE